MLHPHICPLCFHFIQVFRVNSSILLNLYFELLDRVVCLYNEFYSFLLPILLAYPSLIETPFPNKSYHVFLCVTRWIYLRFYFCLPLMGGCSD